VAEIAKLGALRAVADLQRFTGFNWPSLIGPCQHAIRFQALIVSPAGD
jgi:hypothetical protein